MVLGYNLLFKEYSISLNFSYDKNAEYTHKYISICRLHKLTCLDRYIVYLKGLLFNWIFVAQKKLIFSFYLSRSERGCRLHMDKETHSITKRTNLILTKIRNLRNLRCKVLANFRQFFHRINIIQISVFRRKNSRFWCRIH